MTHDLALAREWQPSRYDSAYGHRQLAGLTQLVQLATATAATAPFPVIRDAPWLDQRRVSHRKPSLWPGVRHWAFVLAAMTAVTVALYAAERAAWPPGSPASTRLGRAWDAGSLLWLAATVPAVCELAGLLMHRHPRDLARTPPVPYLVCWRIVSRGTNTDALADTIRRCRQEMRSAPLFRYIIEVVTDVPNLALPAPGIDLAYITVPPSYQTSAGSLFKARALHYATETSPLPDDAWIVHLDEETHPTASGIRGIARMIAEEEASGRLRIGQGTILYHRNWRRHPFLTLADMSRTGDDLGRFHLAHRSGMTLFGMHGSYIVVRNDVEKSVGFDFGPEGSTTEDAFWALLSMQEGHRCRWVHGYLEEQSTEGLMDFLKQRRRWFQGIVKVCRHAPVRFRWRAVLTLSTALWALAPLTAAYTAAHFAAGGFVSPLVTAMADATFAVYIVTGLAGVRINLTEHGIRRPVRRAGWYLLWLLCLPLFSLMESASVAYAIARPSSGFHVVKK